MKANGLCLFAGQRPAYAQIADIRAEVGTAGHTAGFRTCRSKSVRDGKAPVERLALQISAVRTANAHRPGPAIASPYARRTTRVAEIVGLLGHSTGGRPGERLMRRLGMSISDDTILRHLKRNSAPADNKAPPDRRRGALQPTSPLYFEAFLAQCWKDGNRCGPHLYHDIKHRGYTGSFSNLERLLATWCRAERPVVPTPSVLADETHDDTPVRDPQTGHLISPIVAATLCIKPRGALTINQARKVDTLKQGSYTFAVLRSFSMRFRGIFVAGLRPNPKDGSRTPFILASPCWPVLPVFFAVISTPSVTPSTCPGAMVRRKIRSTA